MDNKSVFLTLNEINVNDHTEKKNGLTYLSWAWAWAEAKKLYPDANYKIYETENGCFYFTDGKTCWVKTGVIINGLEHIEFLPVMDFKNQSIPLERVTSFDVNKAIQRSLTKALARHGLGLYIYAGEDLPEESSKPTTTPQSVAKEDPNEKQNLLLKATGLGIDLRGLASYYKKPIHELTTDDLKWAIEQKEKKVKANG